MKDPRYKGVSGWFERRADENEQRQHLREQAKKKQILHDLQEANPPRNRSSSAKPDTRIQSPVVRPSMDRDTAATIIRTARYEAGGAGNARTTKAERQQAMNTAGAVAAALLATQYDIQRNDTPQKDTVTPPDGNRR